MSDMEDDLTARFLLELKSYVSVVLPTLVVYGIESSAFLKIWHAVRQLPYLEKDPDVLPAGDVEVQSQHPIDAEQATILRAQREAIKKEARRTRIHYVILVLVLISIVLFDQYVSIKGWLNLSRDGEESNGYVGENEKGTAAGEGEFDGQSGMGYGWYYDSIFGQIDWTRSYYLITLFLPGVYLLARTLYLVSGLKDRAVLRDTKGMPFSVLIPGARVVPRRPALANITIIIVSALLTTGALWFHNIICIMILFASMIHLTISQASIGKIVCFKYQAMCGVLMVFLLAMFSYNLISSGTYEAIRLLYSAPHAGETNWAGLVLSALITSGSFHFVAMCYRMDYAFAFAPSAEEGEEEEMDMVVGSSDVKVPLAGNAEAGIVEVSGTRISYSSRVSSRLRSSSASAFTSRSHRRPRFAKPYFHTAVLSFVPIYGVIAWLSAAGYIVCEAESAGLFALYVAPPVLSLAVFLRAVVRRELGRVWGYREEWAGNKGKDTNAGSEVKVEAAQEKIPVLLETEKA